MYLKKHNLNIQFMEDLKKTTELNYAKAPLTSATSSYWYQSNKFGNQAFFA